MNLQKICLQEIAPSTITEPTPTEPTQTPNITETTPTEPTPTPNITETHEEIWIILLFLCLIIMAIFVWLCVSFIMKRNTHHYGVEETEMSPIITSTM